MSETLREISFTLIAYMRTLSVEEFQSLFRMKDYHGFTKSRFPDSVLTQILEPYGYTPLDIQIELVKVDTDLSGEIHMHKKAHAFTIVLGAEEHVENPDKGLTYLNGVWENATTHQEIDIPPNTAHTFSVKPGGILYFLSVQTPPIEHVDGHDDYVRLTSVAQPI